MSDELELTPEVEVIPEPVAVEPEPIAVEAVEPEPTPEPEPVVEIVPEPVVVATPKKKGTTPIQVNIDDIRAELPEPAGAFVVGNGVVDNVSLSKIVYKNEVARKSLSVHHLQRRLNELGFVDAYKDRDGYFGLPTRNAIAKFQEANKLHPSGTVDKELLELLFKGDPNVKVVD